MVEPLEDIEEIVDLLHKLMLDPTRVAIWFEILRKPGITAKELMDVIAIKKTAMYYHLQKLEENQVIRAETVKGQRHYHIKTDFFKLYNAKSSRKGSEWEFNLFSLLIVNSLVQREINRHLKILEMKERPDMPKYPIAYTGMWFCSKNKLTQLKEEYKALWEKIKELDDEVDDSINNAEMTYYFGLIDFE